MSAALEAPLNPSAQQQLSQIAGSWDPQQQLWASGFLAGMAAARGVAPVLPGSSPAPGLSGTVLFGSQTGNAQGVAEALASQGAGLGLSLRAVSMADYSPARLKKERFVLVVVSTHGEGDPPDDAEDLWEFLKGEPKAQLSDLNFAVLALGDSSYANFCQTGRDFDQWLERHGAQRLLDLAECDLDYADSAQHWSKLAIDALKPHVPTPTAATPTLHAVPAAPRYSRSQPFAATVEVNQKITGRESDKDVRHVELSVEDSAISYEPGDSLAVLPRNPKPLVEQALAALGLDPATPVQSDAGATLGDALARLELTRITRPMLERYAEAGTHPAIEHALNDAGTLAGFLQGHQVVDLLREYPLKLTPQQVVELLNPVAHRAYSIASAPALHGDSVHLTVARLQYEAFGRDHIGAASTALSDLDVGQSVDVFLDPNPRFRLPEDPARDVIMIGPGTGVAPFRAFLGAREASGASGRNWLFFGDRRFASDFLYQLDWLRWRKSGLLNRLSVAFSRDDREKVYVQHRMAEHAAELFGWLQAGASVYVCGDAEFMAPDVHQALLNIIQQEAGTDPQGAADYLQQLKRDGRYRRDVY